jgi:GntR family transcriptional regulator, transcriptional repressor for pyruvate dehydrogenase complex
MDKNFDAMQLDPIKRDTITEMVAQRMMGLLSDGTLKPGDKLPTERDLARKFQVGRTTVREALKLLTLSGILEAKRGDGTYVRHDFRAFLSQQINWPLLLSNREVEMVFEVREGLEAKTARLAAIHATAEEIEEIGIFREMHRVKDRDIEIETDLDIKFHNAIAKAAHNELLFHLMLSLQGIVRQYIALSNLKSDLLENTVNEHEAVYLAIVSRDPDKAERAMINHLLNGKEWIFKTSLVKLGENV